MAANPTADPVEPHLRLKFYGLADYGTYFQLERVGELLNGLGDASVTADYSMVEVLELHNLQLFLAAGLFEEELTARGISGRDLGSRLKAVVGRFFGAITETNIGDTLGEDVGWPYHADVLYLLGRHKVFERCTAESVFSALGRARFGLRELLGDERLVRSYGPQLRALLMSEPRNAEHVVRKHLQGESPEAIFLPKEFSNDDARSLLAAYVDNRDANLNVVQLIASARIATGGIVDARLKLDARRAHQRLTEEFFATTTGLSTGVEVSLSPEQDEPVEVGLDGMVLKYSYSRAWLEETTSPESILNNLIYVFMFVTDRMLLTMPAQRANPGLVDRLFTTRGREDYPSTSFFRLNEDATLLQMHLYEQLLRSKGVELESVFTWVFDEYLGGEYGLDFFQYSASTTSAPYLQRCRHVLVEMESIAKQFSLYVENGALDVELLAVVPDQVLYRSIPSLMVGKYVYAAKDRDGNHVLDLLFSNQAGLGYIDEGLRGETLSDLLTDHHVKYEQFHAYQQRQIDYLIDQQVLVDLGDRVWFAKPAQFVVLRDVFHWAVASYFHYRPRHRVAVDELVDKGWLVREGTLLSRPEAEYFNYVLNQVDFADGPNLRNRYLHGSHRDSKDEAEHYRSYLVILKMLAALVIKINDDFWTQQGERADEDALGDA